MYPKRLCCNLLCGAREAVVGSAGPSGSFEFEVHIDELDRFGEHEQII